MNGIDYWGEGTGVSNVLSQLQGLDPSQNIVLHVNSVGGEVSAGVTIYNRLRDLQIRNLYHRRPSASIASIISMAGDEIHMALGSE